MLRKGQYINHTKLLKLLFWLMFQLLRTVMMSRGSLLPPPTVWATCRRPAAGAASTAPELWDRWGSSAILTEPSKINSAAHRLIRGRWAKPSQHYLQSNLSLGIVLTTTWPCPLAWPCSSAVQAHVLLRPSCWNRGGGWVQLSKKPHCLAHLVNLCCSLTSHTRTFQRKYTYEVSITLYSMYNCICMLL